MTAWPKFVCWLLGHRLGPTTIQLSRYQLSDRVIAFARCSRRCSPYVSSFVDITMSKLTVARDRSDVFVRARAHCEHAMARAQRNILARMLAGVRGR